MDFVLFQHDQSFVLDRFGEGEFDYVDGVSEVEETEFFRYIGAHKVLPKLAESYPFSAREGGGSAVDVHCQQSFDAAARGPQFSRLSVCGALWRDVECFWTKGGS